MLWASGFEPPTSWSLTKNGTEGEIIREKLVCTFVRLTNMKTDRGIDAGERTALGWDEYRANAWALFRIDGNGHGLKTPPRSFIDGSSERWPRNPFWEKTQSAGICPQRGT